MSVRQWAVDRGVSTSVAGRAAMAGAIQVGADGLVDGRQADVDFVANRRPRVDSPTPRPGQRRGVGRPRSAARTSLAAEQARLVKTKRLLAEEQLRRERDGSVTPAEVEALAFTTARATRDALMQFSNRLAPRLVMQELPAIRAAVDEECLLALDHLRQLVADYLQRLQGRGVPRRRHRKKGTNSDAR